MSLVTLLIIVLVVLALVAVPILAGIPMAIRHRGIIGVVLVMLLVFI